MRLWGTCLVLILTASSAVADITRVIVNRNDTTETLYIAVPLAQASGLMDAPEGNGDPSSLSEPASLSAQGPGGEIAFTPMSVILHADTAPVPFETPWDATLATTICTDPVLADRADADTLRVYAAYVARNVDGLAGFTLTLPVAVDDVTLADFAKGRLVSEGPSGPNMDIPAMGGGFWAQILGRSTALSGQAQ